MTDDVVAEAERIVRMAAETLSCPCCGWMAWEHAVRPEHCRRVAR